MQRLKVLLADDHAPIAEHLRAVLEPEFEVVGTVGDGQALVNAAETLDPDVIVTDISMPILDGMEAAGEILRKNTHARILFLTVHNDPALVRRGMTIGGSGYVLKLCAGDELVPAIHAALQGEYYVSPAARGAAGHTISPDRDGGIHVRV